MIDQFGVNINYIRLAVIDAAPLYWTKKKSKLCLCSLDFSFLK